MTVLASAITTFWKVPSMRMTINCQDMKKSLRTVSEILTHWPQHKQNKQRPWCLWPQQTEHSVMLAKNSNMCGCHMVVFFGNNHSEIIPTGDRNEKYVICNGPHWASQCPEKQGKPDEMKGEPTAHTAHSEFAMAVHTETSMFAREAGNRKGTD